MFQLLLVPVGMSSNDKRNSACSVTGKSICMVSVLSHVSPEPGVVGGWGGEGGEGGWGGREGGIGGGGVAGGDGGYPRVSTAQRMNQLCDLVRG